MTEGAPSLLAGWSSFYVMTGSSAAALTGLMFVVITLVTRMEDTDHARDGTATFNTPTVVHFCAALLVSGVLAAPWHTLRYPAAFLAFVGLCGVLYVLRIIYRTRGLSIYSADLEDWLWYTILPIVAYVAMLAGGIWLFMAPAPALFALAGAVLFLIFIGIRNAWDVVTYITISALEQRRARRDDG